MTTLGRAVFGASLGALLTLLIHPVSRPYLFSLVSLPGAEAQSLFNPAPTNVNEEWSLLDAANWLHTAAEKLQNSGNLSTQEIDTAIEITSRVIAREPTNAFWLQLRAVFENQRHQPRKVLQDWELAAAEPSWNDHQSDLLLRRRTMLGGPSSHSQSWEFAYLYRQRSFAAASLIEDLARALLSHADYHSLRSLGVRYAAVMNGSAIRDGSRNVKLGEFGADIVELGAYPSALSGRRNPHRLLLGEDKLFNNLMETRREAWAHDVQYQFDKNDGWKALANSDSLDDEIRDLGMESVVVAALPSALIVTGLVGAFIWGIGRACSKSFANHRRFGRVAAFSFALILGVSVQALTSFPLAAIAAALCGGFIAASPAEQRKARPKEFGPTFAIVMSSLALFSGGSLLLFLVSISTPGQAVLPLLSMPKPFVGGSPLFIGLSVLSFAMLFLVTPFWAFVQRLATPFVLSEGLQRFGSSLAFACLGFVVFFGPIAIYADERAGDTLSRLLENEPVYYLTQHAPRT